METLATSHAWQVDAQGRDVELSVRFVLNQLRSTDGKGSVMGALAQLAHLLRHLQVSKGRVVVFVAGGVCRDFPSFFFGVFLVFFWCVSVLCFVFCCCCLWCVVDCFCTTHLEKPTHKSYPSEPEPSTPSPEPYRRLHRATPHGRPSSPFCLLKIYSLLLLLLLLLRYHIPTPVVSVTRSPARSHRPPPRPPPPSGTTAPWVAPYGTP